MKYEGTKISGADKTVFTFSFGKEELEILLKLTQQAYENTPKVFEIMRYRGRLRGLTLALGKVYVEEIKKLQLPTKRVHLTQAKIKMHINRKSNPLP